MESTRPVLPAEMFARYEKSPSQTDGEVRRHFKLPENRYYTVTTWPPHLAGRLFVDLTRTRVVHTKKISKSDSPV